MIATHPRRRDVPPRRRLTQAQLLHAILEQRREPEIQKQPSLIELCQVSEKLRRDLVTPSDDARKPSQEFLVRQ
jgi:hypothetical protein